MTIFRNMILVVLALYLLLLAVVFVFQRSLLYFSTHDYVTLAEAHANKALRELPVKTADGIELKA